MKVLELFAGTRSIGKAFEAAGHEVFSVEWDKHFENIDLYKDILTLSAEEVLQKFGRPDVIWASPDCTSYSIAAISHHRRREENGNLTPVSDYAKFCDRVINTSSGSCSHSPRVFGLLKTRGGGCAKWIL